MLHAVIMAGGSGTRFWPASRADRPKQLLPLAGDETMLQATVARLAGWIPARNVLVVTNQALLERVRTQLPALRAASVLGEPCKRDTAPCIGVAAAAVAKDDPDAVMLVMPSDHVIRDVQAFRQAVDQAVALIAAEPGRLVTFGIVPTYPAESFGYIERSGALGANAYRVAQFREKPRADVARGYLESGNFYWNAGIFVWRAQTILDLLAQYEPTMSEHIQTIAGALGSDQFEQVFAESFAKIEGTSIDYAVMERAPDVAVVEAPFDWDDVGSWSSLARLRGVDDSGNTLVGSTGAIETQNTIVCSDDDHLVATVGVEDLIVVHTPSATLVARRSDEESVRKVVAWLQEQGLTDYL